MNKFIEMDFDEWFETYKPIKNTFDENASFDGYMWETYGDEVNFVKCFPERQIWMYGDGDDGGSYIWSGWHFVNRLGYFITEVPFPADTDIQIKVSSNWYFCESCHAELEDPDNLIRDSFQEHDLEKCTECATIQELTLVGLENYNANV